MSGETHTQKLTQTIQSPFNHVSIVLVRCEDVVGGMIYFKHLCVWQKALNIVLCLLIIIINFQSYVITNNMHLYCIEQRFYLLHIKSSPQYNIYQNSMFSLDDGFIWFVQIGPTALCVIQELRVPLLWCNVCCNLTLPCYTASYLSTILTSTALVTIPSPIHTSLPAQDIRVLFQYYPCTSLYPVYKAKLSNLASQNQ